MTWIDPGPTDPTDTTTFAYRLYEQLLPFQKLDTQGHLWALCDGFYAMFQEVEELIKDRDDGLPGYANMLDINACRSDFLSWLAQFVGANPMPGLSDTAQRGYIASLPGFNRCRPDTIKAAVAATLTGTKTVDLRERQSVNSPTVTNEVLNPSFEYDTVGQAPAFWTPAASGGGWATQTFLVENDWAAHGIKSLRAAFTGVGNGQVAYPAPPTNARRTTTPGEAWSARCTFNVRNSQTTPEVWINWYDVNNVLLSATQQNGISRPGVQEITITGVKAPANAAFAELVPILGNVSGAVATMDSSIDKAMLIRGAVLLDYFDGDDPGYEWTGTPGDSTSQMAALHGVAQISGAGEFISNAWRYVVITKPSETPNPAATLAAIAGQKPGPDTVQFWMLESPDYEWMKANFATYAALKAAEATYADLKNTGI